MQAIFVAERRLPPGPGYESSRQARCRLDGDWQVQTSDTTVWTLAADLGEVRYRFDLPYAGKSEVHADLGLAAVSGVDRVAMVDRSGRTVWQHQYPTRSSVGSCGFSHDGDQLWAVVPAESAIEWWVLETGTGRVLDRAVLDCGYAVDSTTFIHPDRRSLGVDLGVEGFGWLGWGRWVDDRIDVVVRESPDGFLAGIHPSGEFFLTIPSIDEDTVTVCRYPDGAVTAARIGSDIFSGDTFLDACGGYLDAERVIVKSLDGQTALLTADTLDVIDRVEYPTRAGSVRPEPLDLVLVQPSGRGTWTTFNPNTGQLLLWQT